jgi:hypothetical protein
VSDNSDDDKEFISIKKFEIQFPLSLFFPFRRRGFYASDSNDKKIIERINDKRISGDEDINIEKSAERIVEGDVERVVERVVEEIIRTCSDRKIKKARISLPYYGEMEIKRNENLRYKTKFKIARRQ